MDKVETIIIFTCFRLVSPYASLVVDIITKKRTRGQNE
jgi:hypothetical protein